MRTYRSLLLTLAIAGAVCAADSVWTEPAKPTTTDSITFQLFLENLCCCAEFHNVSVTSEDTVIHLNHEFDTRACQLCKCLLPGAQVSFRSAPLAARTYGVYSAGQVYCAPGDICPYGMMIPVRVGQITVTGPQTTRARHDIRGTVHHASEPLFTLSGRPADAQASGILVNRSGGVRAIVGAPVRGAL